MVDGRLSIRQNTQAGKAPGPARLEQRVQGFPRLMARFPRVAVEIHQTGEQDFALACDHLRVGGDHRQRWGQGGYHPVDDQDIRHLVSLGDPIQHPHLLDQLRLPTLRVGTLGAGMGPGHRAPAAVLSSTLPDR